ncbi:SCO2583 family membrane protein [Streptomyces sp. DW26H14]|uniref:SCO2583 family membrane protein n=1 Tax=Streptomyces sp. DW26H14 TaxID=3435395 RepID=UPI00403E2BCB
MAGREDPPEGTPDGPPGGDDEYRSVVFDESFVRAARLQEFSARERMTDREHAVRVRGARTRTAHHASGRGPRRLLALFVLIALAFGTAVYLGFRQPYRVPAPVGADGRLRMTVVPLAPAGAVPGGTPADLLAHSPAAHFARGGEGIRIPSKVVRTADFTESQIRTALFIARDYLEASSLDADVLAGRDRQPVRTLLDPEQIPQFDRSFAAPAADGLYDPAGWLVAFAPAKVRLVAADTRVHGTLQYQQTADRALEVTSDHTFVYTLRPAGSATAKASLFTVRRELSFRFDLDDLEKHTAHLVESEVGAGPEACSAGAATTFTPLLAGARAPSGSPAGVDPYATGRLSGELCGVLTGSAEPAPTTHPAPAATHTS